jgi:hypothetical protein
MRMKTGRYLKLTTATELWIQYLKMQGIYIFSPNIGHNAEVLKYKNNFISSISLMTIKIHKKSVRHNALHNKCIQNSENFIPLK